MPQHGGASGAGARRPETTDPATFAGSGDFSATLTDLRLKAGLTVRDVARRTGIPVSTLSGYFSGRHLPPATRPEVVEAILEALGVPPRHHGAWLAAVRRLSRRSTTAGTPSPYPGLRAYSAADATLFRGRTALTARLVDLVGSAARAASGIVVVTGASGAGKSSLLRAGLGPRLTGWEIIVATPGPDPRTTVLDTLARLDGSRSTCLVLDQFEELWTLGATAEDRTAVVEALLAWATAPSPHPARVVVLGLRADFYASAAELPALHSALQDRQLLVGPLDPGELAEAIAGPAATAGAVIDPGFVDFLVGECQSATSRSAANVLPHLNHALATMWEGHDGEPLTLASYVAIGGLTGAVTATAEAAWTSLATPDQPAARHLLLQLVSVDDDLPPAAVELPLDRFTDAQRVLIRHFADARLLTVDTDTVRLSHEAVITSWPRLQAWIEEDRGLLLQHRMVGRETAAWQGAGQDDGLLLRGSRLAAVRDWPSEWTDALDPDERSFVEASIAQQEATVRSRRRRSRQLRGLLVGTSVTAVLALIASIGYLATNQTLHRERDEARSRQLAAISRTVGQSNAPAGAQLALAALSTSDTVDARSAVIDATASPATARIVGAVGHRTTAASPTRQLLAVAGGRSTLEIYDTSGPTPRRVAEVPAPTNDSPDAAIFAMSFSRDGDLLALGGTGAAVRVLDVSDPAKPTPIGDDLTTEGTVYAIAFGQDGRLLAGTQLGGIARWVVNGGTITRQEALPVKGSVQALALSDDEVLAAGDDAGLVHLWPALDPLDGEATAAASTTPVADLGITSIAADRGSLLVGSRDRMLRRLPLNGTALGRPTTVGQFKSWVNASAAVGNVVVAGSSDSTVGVWRSREDVDGIRLSVPAGVTDIDVVSSTVVAVGLANGQVHVINLAKTLVYPGPGIAFSTYFSRGSNHLLVVPGSVNRLSVFSTDPDSPTRLVDVANDDADDRLNGVGVLSPDGDLVVAARRSGVIVGIDISNPDDPRVAFTLKVSDAMPEHMAFDDSGEILVVGGDDNLVHVVDLGSDEPRILTSLKGPTNYVLGVAISADGSMIAAASLDTNVWLWRKSGDGWSAPTKAATGGHAFTVAFDPTKPLLVGSGVDRVVHVWAVDEETPREVARLEGPDNDVYQAAFSPSGTLAVSSLDATVRLWSPRQLLEATRGATVAAGSVLRAGGGRPLQRELEQRRSPGRGGRR